MAAQPLEALQPLLSAVLPPSVTLEALELEHVSFSAAAVQGCTRLTALERMSLIRCQFDAAAAAALFSNSPQLAALQLRTDARIFSEDEAGGSPADQLQLLPQLQWLRISAGLTGVPPQLIELTRLQSVVSRASSDGWSAGMENVTSWCASVFCMAGGPRCTNPCDVCHLAPEPRGANRTAYVPLPSISWSAGPERQRRVGTGGC